jgi:hypothetical protein
MNDIPFPLPMRGAGSSPLVDFVVVAEFDIDKGSTVRHCYPPEGLINEIYNSDYFANNMLPEGAHNRSIDWTYMILNRDSQQVDEVNLMEY